MNRQTNGQTEIPHQHHTLHNCAMMMHDKHVMLLQETIRILQSQIISTIIKTNASLIAETQRKETEITVVPQSGRQECSQCLLVIDNLLSRSHRRRSHLNSRTTHQNYSTTNKTLTMVCQQRYNNNNDRCMAFCPGLPE